MFVYEETNLARNEGFILRGCCSNIVDWADSAGACSETILVIRVLKSAHILSSTWDNPGSFSNPELKINVEHYRGPPGPACSSTMASDQFWLVSGRSPQLSEYRGSQGPGWGDCALFWKPQRLTGSLLSLKILFVLQRHSRTKLPAAEDCVSSRLSNRHLLFPTGFLSGPASHAIDWPHWDPHTSTGQQRGSAVFSLILISPLWWLSSHLSHLLGRIFLVTLDLPLPFAFPVQIVGLSC